MIAPWSCSARPNSGAYFHCPSHCLPTIARRFLERRAVAIGLGHLRWLRPRSGADFVEQLTDKTERVNLIVVPAGRETQQLGPQVSKPWCALPHVEAEHRHAAAHGLRAHGLVATAHELLADCVGVTLDCAALEKRAHAGNDLPVLLGPERRLPLSYHIAPSLDPDIGGCLAPPEIEQIHAVFRVDADNDVHCVVAAMRGDGVV